MMRKYEVEVRETLSRTVVVGAYNELDAMERGREHYKTGKLILDADDYSGVSFHEMEKEEYWGR